jgi:hypothetical protein
MEATQKYYRTIMDWWERVAKKQLLTLFVRERAERRRDEQEMENVYYACIYDILQSSPWERKQSRGDKHVKGEDCSPAWQANGSCE